MTNHVSIFEQIAIAHGRIKPIPQSGVGTELKKLLAKIGIKPTPHCSCNARAKHMDIQGIKWCEENIPTIVGWLEEEATKRKLPFIYAQGWVLVKAAIRKAKKKLSNSNTVQ
jgi:hypothetical protein